MPQFFISTRAFFGKDAINNVQGFLKGQGIKRLAFVVDKNLSKAKTFIQLLDFFKDEGFSLVKIEYFDASSEPTYDLLDEFTEVFRGLEFDGIMAVGGGSVLDLAKGVGILLKNPGKGIDYRGTDRVKMPGIPVICLPATAGTGSEVTHTASFIDRKSNTKLGINGRYVSPVCGVMLPELTFSCPTRVTVYSGLDAMLHAIEAVTAKTANPVTAILGSKAFSLLFANFKEVLANPESYEARGAMLLGSYLAGIAMMNAGGGPASGISYPLGVHFGVPHGLAGGIFLPHVIEYNILNGYMGYADIYDYLPCADFRLTPQEESMDFLARFKALYDEIGAPKNLFAYKVGKTEVNILAKLTMEQRVANLELNPVPFGEEDVVWLLNQVV